MEASIAEFVERVMSPKATCNPKCAVGHHPASVGRRPSSWLMEASIRGGGLTRIAVRKYTHPARKHLGNGPDKFVTGDPLRNNMSYDTRCSLVSVASKYKAMQGASRKEHMPSDVSAFGNPWVTKPRSEAYKSTFATL